MKPKILDFIDFEKVNSLLEGFNKSTGFVTAILDLEGNVLSKSGWRQVCTEFHRVNPETSEKCRISDTVLANKMSEGEKYHFYKCLNGLVDVAVPVLINGEHVANLFSGQFFFEKPDLSFFKKQAKKYGFVESSYLEAIEKVPVVSQEKVKAAMDFLLNMTQLISDLTFQRFEQTELINTIQKNEHLFKLFAEYSPASIAMFDNQMRYMMVSHRFMTDYNLGTRSVIGLSHYEIFPEISERWKDIHRRCLAGETISDASDIFPRADGTTDWVRWEIRPWYETENQIGGIILFSEVITTQVETREKILKSERQLSQILERISDGFGSLDRDWHYTYVNERLAQNVGRKREELLGNNIWTEFPEAIGTPVHKAYLRAMEEQVFIELEHFFTPLGKWFQHRFYPSLDGLSVFSKDITERKQSEEKLRDNNSLIRIAAEKAKLGGWNVDLKENRSYWSDVVDAIHEMPPGYAPMVEDGINFYAPEWHDRITKVFTDCATNGVPYDEEMEIITSSGKRVWIRTIGEAVKDENGNIYKVEGAFQDISEKKIAEAKVREKDLQFRKLSSNVPDLIFQFTRKPDGSYCVPVASEGIINIFGCTPEDVVDDFTPIGKVIYPEDAERVIADIEYSANNLTQFTCEFRVLIPGRPIQWILSRSSPEKLPDGSITWFGFNANLTHRKEVEDALRESEGKFRKIYEDGPYGMSLVNTEYKFILANGTFCRIMGYTESELIGLTFSDITYPDDKEKDIKSIKQLIRGEIPVYRSEKRYVRKDGQIIWGSITVTANFDKNGKFLYNLAIVEDITGRKNAEEEIRLLNSDLEKRVTERTAQLEVSNKELEAFSYSVSHDLRAPLRHINGFAEILTREHSEEMSDEARKHLNTIIASAHKMGILIDDLLSLSKTGRTELKKTSISMELIVKDALKQIAPAINDRNIDWIISPLPEVYGDYNLLRLAWVNLLDNAVKYTAHKEIAKISIGYLVENNMFVFHISDNGVGFDMKYSHKLFGVFQRLHSSTQFEGTGIGLANVRRIIGRHGGNTWAEAEPGNGATFYFSIPMT